MQNTTGLQPSIEEIRYPDGQIGLRFKSPKSNLWFLLYFILGPAACTSTVFVGTSPLNTGIALTVIAVLVVYMWWCFTPTVRELVMTPGVGISTPKGDLPFSDIDKIYLIANPKGEQKPGGVVAVSKGQDIQLAHTSTTFMARDLLKIIEGKGYNGPVTA